MFEEDKQNYVSFNKSWELEWNELENVIYSDMETCQSI